MRRKASPFLERCLVLRPGVFAAPDSHMRRAFCGLPGISNEPSVVIMSRGCFAAYRPSHGYRILREYQAGRRASPSSVYFLIFTVLVITSAGRFPRTFLSSVNGQRRHFVFHLTQRQRACRVSSVCSISLGSANWDRAT